MMTTDLYNNQKFTVKCAAGSRKIIRGGKYMLTLEISVEGCTFDSLTDAVVFTEAQKKEFHLQETRIE